VDIDLFFFQSFNFSMLQLEKLRELCSFRNSGVTAVKKKVHIALELSFHSDINSGIMSTLNNHLQEFYPE
jgi:hypothetical protein